MVDNKHSRTKARWRCSSATEWILVASPLFFKTSKTYFQLQNSKNAPKKLFQNDWLYNCENKKMPRHRRGSSLLSYARKIGQLGRAGTLISGGAASNIRQCEDSVTDYSHLDFHSQNLLTELWYWSNLTKYRGLLALRHLSLSASWWSLDIGQTLRMPSIAISRLGQTRSHRTFVVRGFVVTFQGSRTRILLFNRRTLLSVSLSP